MNDIIETRTLPLPLPRVPITIRPGTMDDLAFMDGLQKKTTKQVGWMPTKQFEGKVKLGHVLVAETMNDEVGTMNGNAKAGLSLRSSLGYLIGNDQYFKRDDVGIIYQINVIPEMRRSLVAASLLKAQFERSAYGCRLYCCWCAQDIAANRFWEATGFVPLAFRAGSEKRSRVHIFWQKRIRAGDVTTPWWFPSKTVGGSIREDRIVLPIPPGMHWSDTKPLILPGMELNATDEPKKLPDVRKAREAKPKAEPIERTGLSSGGLRFAPPKPADAVARMEKPKRKPKPKNDPRLVAAARELRDRWLENVNAGAGPVARAKWEVSRAIGSMGGVEARAIGSSAIGSSAIGLLPAA